MLRILLASSLVLAGCATAVPQRETLLAGETMGSAWTVKVVGALPHTAEQLRAGVQSRFDAVNAALSTWMPDSALSRFNRDDSGEWVSIDSELAAVVAYALTLAAASEGAYDITVGPLVDLWGFGPDPATHRVPESAAISLARARVGWRKVEVDATAGRARKQRGVRLDLSSLGKGRGVDRVAEYLDGQGVSNYLIDLSGKLRARGRNARGKTWRVAVERPGADSGSGESTVGPATVKLDNASVATAGDYRRYFQSDGQHYSHIIDPRSGYPVTHTTVSATALGHDCMSADALATVFMVMPPDDALRLAERLQAPALLIAREPPGLRLATSSRWPSN